MVVIGAGAAGLTAGYLLGVAGADFTVVEASEVHGGRVQKNADFVDFPLDLGGEWIHTTRTVLEEISQQPGARRLATEYRPMTSMVWDGKTLVEDDSYARGWRREYRFIDITWYDFFDTVMASPIADQIFYDTPIERVDYSSRRVEVVASDGSVFEGDTAIVTVPLAILKTGGIEFDPPLPAEKVDAMGRAIMPNGLKAFFEFSERFYPDIVFFDENPPATLEAERIYYNVSLDKPTTSNVLGLFGVGNVAERYTELSEAELKDYALAELDAMFDGAASAGYVNHLVQNWTNQPHIMGSYSMFRDRTDVATLGAPVDETLYFAGEAYNLRDNWGFVHTAARAAYDTVEAIVGRG